MEVHSLIVKNFLFQAIQFSQTVLIQTIQFKHKYTVEFYSTHKQGPIRVDLGAMVMKGCSAFPKASTSLELHH